MKSWMIVGAAVLSVSLAGQARAENEGRALDPFMNPPPKESIYATSSHLGFSWRITLIDWLGGVPIVRESEVRSSEKERWWGQSVKPVSQEALRGTER